MKLLKSLYDVLGSVTNYLLKFNFPDRLEGWFYSEVGKSNTVPESKSVCLEQENVPSFGTEQHCYAAIKELPFCLGSAGVVQGVCGGKCVN